MALHKRSQLHNTHHAQLLYKLIVHFCFNIHVCVTSVRTTEVASPDLLELECYYTILYGLSNVYTRVQAVKYVS